MAGVQPQDGHALTADRTAALGALVERHRDGELSLAEIARELAGTAAIGELRQSGLNACEVGVVEASVARLTERSAPG